MSTPQTTTINVSPVTEVNFLTAVYPSGQMNLPSRKAESSTIFPENKKESLTSL